MKKLLRDSNGPSPLTEDIIASKGTSQDHEDEHEEEEEEEEDYIVKRPPARNLFALVRMGSMDGPVPHPRIRKIPQIKSNTLILDLH